MQIGLLMCEATYGLRWCESVTGGVGMLCAELPRSAACDRNDRRGDLAVCGDEAMHDRSWPLARCLEAVT